MSNHDKMVAHCKLCFSLTFLWKVTAWDPQSNSQKKKTLLSIMVQRIATKSYLGGLNCQFQLNPVLAGHEKHRNGIGRGLWEWSPQKTWKKIFLQMVHLQHNLLKEHLYGRLMSKKPFLRSRIRVSCCM